MVKFFVKIQLRRVQRALFHGKINEHGINFVSHIDGKKFELTPESAIQIQERLNF